MALPREAADESAEGFGGWDRLFAGGRSGPEVVVQARRRVRSSTCGSACWRQCFDACSDSGQCFDACSDSGQCFDACSGRQDRAEAPRHPASRPMQCFDACSDSGQCFDACSGQQGRRQGRRQGWRPGLHFVCVHVRSLSVVLARAIDARYPLCWRQHRPIGPPAPRLGERRDPL